MFYGTSVMQIVDKELKLEVGDNFTIMKAMTNQGMIKASLAHLGFHKRPAPSVARTIKEFIPRNAPRHQSLGHDLGIERKWEKVDDFLSDILTANSNYDESNSQYRLAQTIADVMLRISGVDGIAYPSVATSLKGINLCLLPEFVDASFRAKRFYMFQVLDRVNGDNLIATPAVNGVPDGERIVWAN